MGRTKRFRYHVCPHCKRQFRKSDQHICTGCGRICTGTRWCCVHKGMPFTKRRHYPLFNDHCPVCEPDKWVFPLLN
jgi:hypothetical protein